LISWMTSSMFASATERPSRIWPPFPRLAQQLIDGAASDHLAPVQQEALEHLLEVQCPRLAVNQRHSINAEDVLKLRLL